MRWVWLLVMLVLWTSPVHADEAADRAEAGRAFAAGQAADRKKDWPAAIQHYIRANDLSPHPNAMFNIATDYERLGDLRQAAVWYQRYVEAAPDAPDRERITRLIRELAQRPTTLTVRTIPPGAKLLVDGEPRGTTPYSGKINGGRHRITLEHEGRSQQEEISVEYGVPAVLERTLRGQAGTLRVVGPPGAALVVDGMPAGALPTSVELPPGTHTLQVTAYGYAAYTTTAEITPNRETLVEAKPERAGGTGRTVIKAGYLFGAAGGADARGAGAVVMIDLGIQALRYDAAVRIGKAGGRTAVDLVARWAIGASRLTPYIGAGYSAAKDSTSASASGETVGGYVLIGGVRYLLTQSEHALFAAVAESGLRYYPGLTEGSLIVPLMFTLQVVYR